MRLCYLIAILFYMNNIKYAKNTIFDHALSNLSKYDFFEKPLKNHIPKKDVIPYEIASPLFSDYAEKMRFIRVPDGSKILLGHPEKSIIEFRINSVDPGIMMPELSRKLIHKERVELIQTWIREMDLLE